MVLPDTPVHTETLYCVNKLTAQLEKINGDENIQPQTTRRLLVSFVECFIQFERDTRSRLDDIETLLRMHTKQEVLSDIKKVEPPKDSDSFKAMLLWLRENVLPKLVELLILTFFAWLIVQIRAG